MWSEHVKEKAVRLVAEDRVTVHHVSRDADGIVVAVAATVRGDTGVREVEITPEERTCTGPCGQSAHDCSHRVAALVAAEMTDHATAGTR